MEREPLLFEIAHAYDQRTRHRRPPQLPERPEPPGPYDAAAESAIRLKLGQRAFDEVLREGSSFDLTPERFYPIAASVLREEGWTWLTGSE